MQARRRPLVLLADDDARSARHLARMLREDGFDVELVVDGAAAIARLARNPIPDAVVTDMFLRHADGLAVARYARSRSGDLSAVVLTGHAELVPAEDAVVLTKPLDYDALMRTLRPLTT